MTIRTALRFALSAFLGTAAIAGAETTYLPGAAEVTGLAGARFSSTLELSNPGTTGTTATIGLVPMAGKAAPAPVTRTLAAGESLRISEALKTLFGLADGAAGTLTLTSDEPLLANLSTRNVAAPEGAYGLGLLPVPSSDLLGAGETGHSIWVSQSADPAKGYRTNLSVTLVDPGTVVEVRVLAADGRVAGSTTVTAEAAQVWQQPAAALIGYGTDLAVGRAEFEVKAGRATAYAVVNDNVTSDAIALQTERVVPGPTDRLISGAALAPGQLGSFWSTDLRLFNPGSTAVDATIQSVGASREASAVVTVPAKGVVEVTRALSLLGFPEGTACALRVRAGASLLVAARTNNVDPAGIRKGTFSAQQFVTSWPAGLLGAGALGFFNGVDQSFNVPGVRTNLTVVGGPEGTAGELVLRDAAGLEHGRRAFARGPGEWGQLSVADWFAPAVVPENSRVDVAVATGALDAFVSRIDNGSGDAITRPVALLGGEDCTKIAVTSFDAEPKPITAGVSTSFSWTVVLDPPTAELTSQSIRFDGEAEIELGKDVRSYTRSFDAAAARSATLTVRKGSCVKTRSLTFFVCGPLSLEPTTLPDATAFVVYPPRTITAAGATAPTTVTVTAGVLPGGMSLSAEGELSGRPDEVGLFTFTAKAVDANGCVGTREYALRVFCPTLRIVPTTLPAGTVAVPYPSIRFTVTGGSGTGTWSATGLPPGLALSTGGQLSGTPTAAGSYTVAVRFRDSSGCIGTASYTVLVCNTLVLTPGTLSAATAGTAYGPVTFTAGGATGAATWTVTTGSLPAGVTLNAGTGVLSGTPTVVGTFPLTVTATDSLGCTGSVAVSLVVNCPVITVNPATLVAAFEDAPYTATLTQTGGNPGATYTVVAGTLPAGLTLSPATGVLSGTVAIPGSTNFTVRATDPVTACFGDRAYTFTVTPVNDAPSFVKGPDALVLEDSGPYSAAWATAISAGPVDESGQVLTFNVTGNTNPALFSVAPTVSAAGVLGFTPAANASGTATITLTLSDNGGTANGGVDTSAAQTFVVTVTDVNDPPSFTKGPDVTVLEDSAAYSAAWATALSTGPAPEAGQALTFHVTGNTNAALFSAAPAVSPAGVLSFTPAANANGTATITLTLSDNGGTANGGVDTSAAQTFVVNLTPVNDAPSFTKGADVTVLEDSGAHTTAPWATAILAGPADESAQTVSFAVTGNTNAALFSVAPAVSPAGALTFTPAANASGTATVTLTLSDSGGTANGGADTSAAQSFVINVTDVNDAPSFTKGADQTVLEDSGAQTVNTWATAISAGPPSESGQTVAFNVTGNTNAGLFSVAPAVSPAGVLTYTPAANANGTATITLTLSDNGGTANGGVNVSAAQSFVVNVTAVNDAPSFTKGADVTVLEESGAQTVNPWATALVAGPADESAQTFSFSVTGNTNAALFSAAPAVSPAGVLTFTPAANASGSATITLTLSDNGGTANGGSDTSAAQSFVINVTDVNDPPSFTKGADVTVLEDAAAYSAAWATAISAGPASESGQTVAFSVTGNTNATLFSVAPAVSPAGVLSFTPAANANGTATITLTLTDDGGTANGGSNTSAAQSFVVNVTAVNDAPSFTKGADQTVFDNAGAQTVPGWATAITKGPADEASQTVAFSVTGNTNPTLFSVAPAIDPSGTLIYTPLPSSGGSATITIVLTDNGGTANGGVNASAAQTFTITFNHVNVAPSFTKGADVTVLEDAAAYSAAWATAISAGPPVEAGQTLTFAVTGNTNAGLFSVAPAVSPTGVLTFTPAANANGSATITLTLTDDGGTANGGSNTSAAQSFVVNVTAVNDAPSFTKGADQTVFDNAGAQTVPGWATAITKGPADEASQTVAFSVTGNTNPTLFSVAPAIDPSGTLTYTPLPSSGGSATITIVLTDNGGTANGGVNTSAAQTFTITFDHVNVAPSFTKGADQTVNEDAPAQTVNPWATAISAGPPVEAGQILTFNVTGNTNPTLFSAGPAISSAGVLTYTPAANAFGSATITVTLSDNGGTANGGVDTSAAQTFVITVNAVNDVPSFTKGADQSALEDAGAQTANPWATALSAGPANESGQTLTFNVTGNTNAALFSAGPAISPAGVLTWTPAANASGSATITITLSDNGGTANGGVDTSVAQTFVITVNNVNDAPSFAKGADQTVLEDAGAQTVNPWATAISAGPANESGQVLTFNVTGNTNPTLFSAGPAISPAGVLTWTSAPNANGSATITITLSDNGGTANGGVDTSASQTFVINVTPVNDPPSITTTPVSYTTPGNTQLHVAGATLPGVASWTDAQSVTAKAGPFADVDGPGPLLIVPATGSSVNGGTFSIAADGSFTYVPAAGFTGADSFTYQVTDQDPTTPGLTNGTVGIAVGARVWYVRDVVDANNAAGGDGRSSNAFDSIAALNAATTNNGDIIYVFEGSTGTTPLSGTVTLKDGQKLWGQGIALNVPGFATPLVAAANKARIRTTTASTDVVSVPATAGNRQNVEVRGLDLEATGATSNAVDVTASGTNLVGVTISDNNVRGATAEGIDLNAGSTGAFAATVSANAITATGNGIDARTSAVTALSLDISNDTVVSTANGILISGAGGGTLTITGFANNTVDGLTGGTGISVNTARFDADAAVAGYQTVPGGATSVGTSGNPVGASGVIFTNVSGDLAFTDLDVFASNGSGLLMTGTGAVNVGAGTGTRVTVGAGVGVVEATNGQAVDITNATVDLRLSSIRSTNSLLTGVSLVNVADGSTAAVFSAGAGSVISNASGNDFNVDGGNATISYAGPITNTAGRSVSVINRTADTVTFTGAISDTGTGVFLNSNGSSTVTFSGGLVANTGINAAFTATGGGTVVVCDENPCGVSGSNGGLVNTLTTTTGTALNVANTNIGAGDLEFRSISANGGANGIFLQNTGAAGGLKVKGTGSTSKGGDASGGTIRNMVGADGATAGNGIYLENTQNVLLQRMQLNDFQNSAIRGLSVTGFTLQYSTINGVSGDSSAATEGALAFGTIIPGANGFAGGTNLIDNCVVRGAVEHNMEFYSYLAGSNYSLTISNSDVTNNSAAFGGDGIQIELGGGYANTATVSIQNCFFDNNKSQGVQGAANGSSTLDITINGCTLQRTAQGNEGFIVSNGSNGDAIVHMTNNNVSGIGGTAIFVGQTPGNATAASSLTAVVKGNTVTHPTSATNHAIIAFLTSTVGAGAPANILIDGNNVTQNSTSGVARAILVDTPDASTNPAFTATVTSNTVSVGDNVAGVTPIVVQARQSAAGCFDVRNNAASFPNGTPAGVFGIRVRQANTASANLEQGISAGAAGVVLPANNPLATTEVLGTVIVVGNASCATAPL